MRYDNEHKARTRARVLQEAAAAIGTDGPERLGVAAVMSRAGLTHGGFYAHFESKDDLLTEAIGYMFAARYDAFFADLGAIDPRAGLRRFVDRYVSMGHRDARDKGCPIPILAAELHNLPEPAQTRFAQAVDRLIDGVAMLLERAGADQPRSLAMSAFAEMIGAIAVARTLDDDRARKWLDVARTSVLARLDLA